MITSAIGTGFLISINEYFIAAFGLIGFVLSAYNLKKHGADEE